MNPLNVVAGKGSTRYGGYIQRAPLGTPLPTSATTAPDPAFIPQGYVSEDGLTRAISKAYEIIRDWNGDEVRRLKTETSVTVTFSLIESSEAEVSKSVFGDDNVTVVPADDTHGTQVSIAYNGDDAPPATWIFLLEENGAQRCIGAAHAQMVTEDFEQEFTAGSAISYPIDLTFFKDEDGNFFYEYFDDGRVVPVTP